MALSRLFRGQQSNTGGAGDRRTLGNRCGSVGVRAPQIEIGMDPKARRLSLYRGSLRAEKKALGKAVWSLYTEEIISVLGNQVLYWRINFSVLEARILRDNMSFWRPSSLLI